MSLNGEINVRIKQKRDTSSNWIQYNPILLDGEIILVDTDEGETRAKIGDGKSRYNELPFTDEILKNLINSLKGDGISAVTLNNDTENINKSIGNYSCSSGVNTCAGSKCFEFDDTVYVDNQKYNHEDKYYIKDVTDEIFSKLQEIVTYKPVYTVVLNYNYDLRGKLVGVGTDESGTYIQVTNYLEINADVGTTLHDGSYVHFPDYPELGTNIIGTGANAEGYETQALAVATHSEGYDTRAIGKYAHTEGRGTIATYAGHSEGRETAALEENTHAEGDRGAVTGFGGHIEGVSSKRAFDHIFDEQGALKTMEALIETYKSNPFSLARQKATHVEGENNLGLGICQHIEGLGNIGITDYLHIQGKYAEIDYNNEYLDIVGNGADDNNRKNIRTLDREGNGWYAKDIYIKGKTLKDVSLTLNKKVPLTNGYSHKKDFSSEFAVTDGEAVPTDVIGNQYVSGERVICTSGGSGKLVQDLLTDGTLEISNTSANGARYKFFDFLTSKEKFTQDDIGRKFIVSIRYKYKEGHYIRLGLMGRGAVYSTTFYDKQDVITLKNKDWTIANLEITVDEYMVENQIGLITLDFSRPNTSTPATGSIIVDYIESIEVKTFEDILNDKMSKDDVDEAIADAKDNVKYIKEKILKVSENALTEDVVILGTGWSGNLTDGFTHSSGNTEPLTFNINSIDGDKYIVSATLTKPAEGAIKLAIGNSFLTDPYGKNPFVWGVQSIDGGSLTITPTSSWTGTISNLECRKVTDDGTNEVTVLIEGIMHGNMANHLSGFWDIKIGGDVLSESVNTTRCIGIGEGALASLKTGGRNISIGTYSANYMEYGENNVTIGADSAFVVKQAKDCVVIGKAAMHYGKNLNRNVAIGASALYGGGDRSNTESSYNVAIGDSAGYKCGSIGNVFIGQRAGYFNNTNGNIFIGKEAGGLSTYNSTGTGLTIIGQKAGASEDVDYVTVVGNGAIGKGNNAIAIGSGAIAGAANAVQIGKGTNNESGTLKVNDHLLMRADGSLPYVDNAIQQAILDSWEVEV